MKLRHSLLSTLLVAATLAGCGTAGLNGLGGERTASLFGAAASDEQRVEVVLHFGSPEKLQALARGGVDLFENVDLAKGTVGATLTKRTEKVVKRLGVRVVAKQGFEALRGPMPSGYQSVAQVEAGLKALAAKHPQIFHLQAIGQSIEGRSIWAVNLTSKPGQKLPAVRISSGVHARELPPVELSMRLLHLLAEGYGQDAQITRLVDTRDIWIVPVWNPDGRVKVEQGSSMWRKNTRKNRFGDGVDINRNADDHWEKGNGSSWADDYRGASPFSEPETEAVKALTERVDFVTSIDVHCYAGMVLWPPGFDKSHSKDEAAFKAIGERMAKPLGYRAGTIARTIYATFGDFATWEYYKHGTLAFAAELGVSGFNPPYSQVEKQWQDWKPNFLYLIDVTGNPKAAVNPLASLDVFPTR